jgi:hypothetical protein
MGAAIIGNTQTDILGFGQTSVHFQVVNTPKAYVGCKAAEFETDKSELVFGVLREDGKIQMFNNLSDYTLDVTDKLILTSVVN